MPRAGYGKFGMLVTVAITLHFTAITVWHGATGPMTISLMF